MSKWSDPSKWNALLRQDGCPFCSPDGPWHVLLELPSGWLAAIEQAPMPGYCYLIAKRHVIELDDLPAHEAQQFMTDMQQITRALRQIVQPVKLNYEIHGNTIPHLHVHFFPRYRGDRFEHGPINPRVVTAPVYKPGEFERFTTQLRDALTPTPRGTQV